MRQERGRALRLPMGGRQRRLDGQQALSEGRPIVKAFNQRQRAGLTSLDNVVASRVIVASLKFENIVAALEEPHHEPQYMADGNKGGIEMRIVDGLLDSK